MNDISSIIRRIENGEDCGYEELIPLIHQELRLIAAGQMKHERSNHTLSVTGLVNEAFLRLAHTPSDFQWSGRKHFFSAAAEAMRRILIDHARRRNALKRGGEHQKQVRELDELPLIETVPDFQDSEVLELNQALEALEQEDQESASIVKLRFFGGLTYDQIAEHLEISPRTAKNRWAYAKAWLREFLCK